MRKTGVSAAGVRAVFGFSFAASVLLLFSLATSRSEAGAVFGMWSANLAAAIAVVSFWMVLSLLAAFGIFRLHSSVAGILKKLPEIFGPLLLFFLPAAVFLYWFLWSAPSFLRPLFTISVLLFSVVPGCLLLFSRTGKELRSALGGSGIMAFSLIAVLAAGEMVLRAVMPEQIFNPRFGLRPYTRTELLVDLPGVSPGGILSTNMWGFRGDDPPEDWDGSLTIVTVGGSTTANYYLDDSLTWSNVLQEELRNVHREVWVGNAGIPRHSADTHLLFLREVLDEIRPDVVVFLIGVNDMGPFLRPGSREDRLPDSGPRQWLFAKSSILQLLYKTKKVYIDNAPVVSTAVDPYFTEEPMTGEDIPLPEDLHQLLDDPGFYRNRVNLLIDECEFQGITPVFLTQPILYEDTPHWRTVRETAVFFQGTERPISAAAFALMLETLNSDLLDVCSSRGVAAYDLAADIPHTRDCFYDAMHMTEEGADLVGKKVASFLSSYLSEKGLLWPDD